MTILYEKLAVERANYHLAQVTVILHLETNESAKGSHDAIAEALFLLERMRDDLSRLEDSILQCEEKCTLK